MINKKKVKYLIIDENTTIQQLAKEMIKEHRKGYIAKAIFQDIRFFNRIFSIRK